jgi:hypothetical protein
MLSFPCRSASCSGDMDVVYCWPKLGGACLFFKSASAVVVFSFLMLRTCDKGAARGGWEAVVRSCAESDIFQKDVKFFGPSNVLGPGSVWRLQESLSPSFTLANVSNEPAGLVQPGNEIKPCQGKGVSSWDISLGLPLTVAAQGEPNAPASPTGSPISIIAVQISRLTAGRSRGCRC